jgi:hypothetical protein
VELLQAHRTPDQPVDPETLADLGALSCRVAIDARSGRRRAATSGFASPPAYVLTRRYGISKVPSVSV